MWFTKRKKRHKEYRVESGARLMVGTNTHEQDMEIQLIEGSFNAVEAADVLLSLINEKLKYHTVKSLNLDQCEVDQTHSKERIRQLREDKKLVTDLVINANRKGLSIEIEGTVVIRLKEENTHNDKG